MLGFIGLLLFCSIPYIICGIFAFFIMLPVTTKRKRISYNQLKKQNILNEEEEKRIKDKWINDLKNGKRVNIGDSTIKCKNQTLIINRRSFNIKEIQKLKLTYKILGVWKTTTDTRKPISMYRYNIPNLKYITLEQYYADIYMQTALDRDYRDGKTRYYRPNRYLYHYKFDKEYYISILLYNGCNEYFSIAFCPECDTKILNLPEEEGLILELENYINSLKNKA